MFEHQVLSPEECCQRMRDLVVGLAEAMVDKPERVTVETIPEPSATVIRLRVATEDLSKIIGKRGITARSLRTILTAASMKMQHPFWLDILEVEESPATRPSPSSAAFLSPDTQFYRESRSVQYRQ